MFALVCSLSFQSYQTTSKMDDDWQCVFDPLSFDALFAVICRCLLDILRHTWKIISHLLYRTAMFSLAGAFWCNLLQPPEPPLKRWCGMAVCIKAKTANVNSTLHMISCDIVCRDLNGERVSQAHTTAAYIQCNTQAIVTQLTISLPRGPERVHGWGHYPVINVT